MVEEKLDKSIGRKIIRDQQKVERKISRNNDVVQSLTGIDEEEQEELRESDATQMKS